MFYMHFISYYGIYWTNLLTRCHFCLLCLFIAEKAQKPKCSEKSRKITEILFRQNTHGARRARPEEAQGLLPISRRGQEGGGATLWGGPLGTPPTSPLRLYIPPSPKTLTRSTIFHEEFRSRRHREDKFRGTEVSVPARRRDGELPPESSPSTPPTSSSPLLSPMMRRE